MNIHRVGRVLLKVFTCSVGGAMAGLLVYLLVQDGLFYKDVVLNYVLIGASFGLFVGISWAIRRREIRTAFVVPSVLGLLVALVTFFVAVYYNINAEHGFLEDVSIIVFIMAFPVGLFIGIVWSLSRAGAFRDKSD